MTNTNTEANTPSVTELEYVILDAIMGNDDFQPDAPTRSVWLLRVVEDTKGIAGRSGRAVGGALTTLSQKGLIKVNDFGDDELNSCGLTDAGATYVGLS